MDQDEEIERILALVSDAASDGRDSVTVQVCDEAFVAAVTNALMGNGYQASGAGVDLIISW